jgi:hypothetical protein
MKKDGVQTRKRKPRNAEGGKTRRTHHNQHTQQQHAQQEQSNGSSVSEMSPQHSQSHQPPAHYLSVPEHDHYRAQYATATMALHEHIGQPHHSSPVTVISGFNGDGGLQLPTYHDVMAVPHFSMANHPQTSAMYSICTPMSEHNEQKPHVTMDYATEASTSEMVSAVLFVPLQFLPFQQQMVMTEKLTEEEEAAAAVHSLEANMKEEVVETEDEPAHM